jgi:hypothetical protein
MTTNFYDDISPFFSNDGRGVQFVHFNYKGNDYESSINTSNDTDSIIGEPLFQLMIAKNYLSKVPTQNDNDIHQDFVNLIVKTALAHRDLDKPSTNVADISKTVETVKAELNNLTDSIYGDSLRDVQNYPVKDKKQLIDDTSIGKPLPQVYVLIIKRIIGAFKVYDSEYIKNIIFPLIIIGIRITIFYIKRQTTVDVDTFKRSLISNLIDLLTNTVKKIVPTGLKMLSPSTGTSTSSSVFDKVKQLKNLNSNARKFYLANFVILEKNPDGTESLFYDLDKTDDTTRTLRLNFKKSPSNKLRTVFSNSLPLVPSVCEKIYFNVDSNNVKSISLSELKENDRMNILRIIYDNVYSSGNVFKLFINGKEQTFNVNLTQPTQTNFRVNYSKLISSIVNNYGKYPRKAFDNFNDLFLDISTDILYKKDDKGIFRQVDSATRMYYDSSKFNSDIENNCYGTYLNDPSADCKTARVLLNSTPENLVRNLALLKHETLFEVAKSDIQNINPEIMKNIINTFGFIVRKEKDGLYRPAAFNDWIKSSKVNADVKNVVVNNKKLSIYLSEILNILRKNPVLFNQNNPLANPSHPNNGLSVFNIPLHMERPKRNLDLSSLILRTNGEQRIEMPLFLNLQNVGFQTGGNIMNENNSDKIKQMFNQLFMQLEHNGKELKKEDKERIDKVIETATKLETQLNRMYEEIQLYSNLQGMLKDSNVVEGVELSEIHDITSNKTRLEETMQKIREKIQKNLVTQQKVFQTLYLIHDPLIRLITFP